MVKDSPAAHRRHNLREALLAAAKRTIAEKGWQALRARELAAEVGCAVGAIYNVFPDLDALILAVKAQTLDALEGEVQETLGAYETGDAKRGEARLNALGGLYVDFAHRNRRLWFSAFAHSSPETPALEAYMLRLDAILTNIERPLGDVLPDQADRARRLLARALFSAVHGVVSLALDRKLGAISLAELHWQVRHLVRATLQGLREQPPAAPPSR